MTRLSEAIRIRTVLMGLALALLGALTLFISPGGGSAEAASLKKMCKKDGAVADAANNPGLVADCVALLKAKKVLEGKEGGKLINSTARCGLDAESGVVRRLNWSSSLPMNQWDGILVGGVKMESLHGGPSNRVTSIHLGSSSEIRLKGKIPKELGQLSELRERG